MKLEDYQLSISESIKEPVAAIALLVNAAIALVNNQGEIVFFTAPSQQEKELLSSSLTAEVIKKYINKLFKHNTPVYEKSSEHLKLCITSIEAYSENRGYIMLISQDNENLAQAAGIVRSLVSKDIENVFKEYEIKEIVNELLDKHNRLNLFSSISREISMTHNMNNLVQTIGTTVKQTFSFDSGLILLRFGSNMALRVVKRLGKKVDPFIVNLIKRDLADRVSSLGHSLVLYEDSAPEMPPSLIVSPIILAKMFFGLIVIIREKENQPFTNEENDVLQMICMETAKGIDKILLYSTLKKKYFTTIAALAEAIDAKDPYTKGHSSRVSRYSVEIARKMRLSSERIETVQIAAYLHDVGKIGIDESILRKETPLSDSERKLMQTHPILTAKILQPISFMGDLSAIARQHHEKCDGSGYPNGLTKSNILLEARIIALADSFDAMTSDRPYRRAFPLKKAFSILKKDAGRHFDEEVVIAFLEAWLDHLEHGTFEFIHLSLIHI